MKGIKLFSLLALALSLALSGCVVRTYQSTKDRVDQDLNSGNRGYLKGQMPQEGSTKERKTTRTGQVVEIEFHPLITFDKKQKTKVEEKAPPTITEDSELIGNRGYLTESTAAAIYESPSVNFEKYTVQKNDTLQKISQKYYGTTKKWNKIYEANKDAVKGPNKIYPGQVINIPLEALKEPKENLK